MNLIDSLVASFSPMAGLRRVQARAMLNAISAKYEGAEQTRFRKLHRKAPPNELIKRSAMALREQARYYERNYDLARGAIGTYVNNVVGPSGIGILPQPRKADGTIYDSYAADIAALLADWGLAPEVTGRWSWAQVQRLACRSRYRDGEVFSQRLFGPVPGLDHGSIIPYSLELLEADMVPQDYDRDDPASSTRQGIARNAWGKPIGYWVYKTNPDDTLILTNSALKYVPAERMFHVFRPDRIHQIRGVTEFASVITRLEDIKDYEESERIAAKIAAMFTAFVRKGRADDYAATNSYNPNMPGARPDERQIGLQPGMIIDSLGPGEEIDFIDSKRPNPNVVVFRQGQLRAAAAGLRISASSLSRDYNGTYSAQRQELVEQAIHYAVDTDDFTGSLIGPVYRDLIAAAHLSGALKRPRDLRPGSEADCLFVGQSMPWIDPLKEANGNATLVTNGFASTPEIIRARGRNPDDVIAAQAAWNKKCAAAGVAFGDAATTTDPAVLAALLNEQQPANP